MTSRRFRLLLTVAAVILGGLCGQGLYPVLADVVGNARLGGGGGGAGTPGGADTQVQFNDAGAFGGDAGLVFNKTTNVLTAGSVVDSALTATHVVFAGASGLLSGEAAFSYTSGSDLLDVGTINVDTLDVDTTATVTLGTGTGKGSVGGVICRGTGIATTGTSEEVLATCTIPANTLSANGSTIRVSFFGHSAANGNNKQFRIRVGGIAGTVVFDGAANASNDLNLGTGYEPIVITRLSATTATSQGAMGIIADATAGAGSTGRSYAVRAAAITWANANDLVITGTTPTASGDLTLDTYLVEVIQ